MSDISTVLADLKELIGRPLFTLGSTDISIGRVLSALMLIVLVAWFSRFSERALSLPGRQWLEAESSLIEADKPPALCVVRLERLSRRTVGFLSGNR